MAGGGRRTVILASRTDPKDVRRLVLPARICRKISNKNPPAEDNGIFDSQVLSRNHAELFVQGDDIAVRDLGSSNGTFLNDSRITDEPVVLRTGDVLDFGIDVQDEESDLVPPQQARVSVLVHIPADGDSLPDVDIISAPAPPLTAHLQLDDVTRKLKTQLLEEEERSEVLHSLLQLVDGISTYKHSYILVAKELQVKDERIGELSRLSSEQQETIAALRAQAEELSAAAAQASELRAKLEQRDAEHSDLVRQIVKLQKAEALHRSNRSEEESTLRALEASVAEGTAARERLERELANARDALSAREQAQQASEQELRAQLADAVKATRALEREVQSLRGDSQLPARLDEALAQRQRVEEELSTTRLAIKSRDDMISRLRGENRENVIALQTASKRSEHLERERRILALVCGLVCTGWFAHTFLLG